MKNLLIIFSLIGISSCSISPKELDKLYSDTNYYSPNATIRCMQMPPPQRPHPINDKGDTRESYDQDDCVDDTISKNIRELTFDLTGESIKISIDKDTKKLPDDGDDSIDDIDIDAIDKKIFKKKKD